MEVAGGRGEAAAGVLDGFDEDGGDGVGALLEDGGLDLVISTVRPHRPGILTTPLMDEEFALVAGARWRGVLTAESIAEKGPRALENVPVIAYSTDLNALRIYWTTVFDEVPDFRPQAVIPDLRAVLAAVRAGAGIAVLPTHLCAEELDRGDICVLHEPELPPINTLFIATRAGEPETPAVTAARTHLLVQAKRWH
ncbi:substrate-binding domain-containing protein [Kitasatospora sp. NPDC059160]|uniref:substrate-binding domain-containing protein n=1 Tax=Kitasatospora sp. NPDC059160 TaxID=3346748 RepID=UPI00369A9E8A